eukprot:TRINITY_DN121969_c0_g1_i1.p1 TRINITY_DN121969_c0_g1~~TRINITY_DN121969_c0_g1_i1.p1  ORF type:complete len:339 (-),score=94.25 TRINITY_DN121969_c0_g1_i1:97-1113(-)
MAVRRAVSRGYYVEPRPLTPRRPKVRSGSLPHSARRSVSPTRAELCGGVRSLQDEKDHLQALTQRQRDELRTLDEECGRLRAQAAEADLARANLACEGYAIKCAADNARLELWNLEAEARKLEAELTGFHEGATRLRHLREAAARFGAERSVWDAERRQLEQELASARDALAAAEHSARLQDEELANAARRQAAETAELARQRSELLRQREQAAQQRRLWEEADTQRRVVQVREQADVERAKLGEVRSRLQRESEVRRQHGLELQARLQELETLRKELHGSTADNSHLRACLQQSLRGLERIQQQSQHASLLSKGFPSAGGLASEPAASRLSPMPRLG